MMEFDSVRQQTVSNLFSFHTDDCRDCFSVSHECFLTAVRLLSRQSNNHFLSKWVGLGQSNLLLF